MVQKLKRGIHGDVFKYCWRRGAGVPEATVAVKKLRNECIEKVWNTETDERAVHLKLGSKAHPDPEDALAEIGVMQHLYEQDDLPLYILRMMDVFIDGRFTWFVTEFAEGGELFDTVSMGALPELQAKKYSWQLCQAVQYLHNHNLCHRDVSLENILLKSGTIRLMDFGMAVQRHSSSGVPVRYYRAVGKDTYRSPETYIPDVDAVRVTVPSNSHPGDVVAATDDGLFYEVKLPTDSCPGEKCTASVWGYEAAPVDVFASGVCLFIMLTGSPCWRQASGDDDLFKFVFHNGLEALLKAWRMSFVSASAVNLLSKMMTAQPASRSTVEDCLADPWFNDVAGDVPLHAEHTRLVRSTL